MTATLVELIDGTLVASDAEAWRAQTLARHVLNLPPAQRIAWLADFERLHGRPEANRLQSTMWEIHDRAQEGRSTAAGPGSRAVGPSDGLAGVQA